MNNSDQIPVRQHIINTSSLTSAPDTQLCLALKTGIYSGEKRDFLQGSCQVNTFKGVHQYPYFLKLYIFLSFRASFQLFSNILKSFRWDDFIPAKKRITEMLTQIIQSFCKRRINSFIVKLPDFTLAADFGHEKSNLFGTFYFQNQLIW